MKRVKERFVEFESKDFLGMESARSKKGIAVTKHKYFIYLLQAT
jgi:hypothetical protein